MEVELQAVAWDGGEAHRVIINVTDKGPVMKVGYTWRATGDATRWAFAGSDSDTFDPDVASPAHFEAADIEAVLAELRGRFRVVQIPEDRLTNRQMHETTVSTLLVLQKLAARADAREGFIAGIASGVATAIAADMRPAGDEVFIAAFVAELRQNIVNCRALATVSHEFAKVLAGLMESVEGKASNGGTNGIKH